MNLKTIVLPVAIFATSAGLAQTNLQITAIGSDGILHWQGGLVGSMARVEWASSLTVSGRTDWHPLASVLMTNDVMKADLPLFFRVVGQPSTTNSLMQGLVGYYLLDGQGTDQSFFGNDLIVSGATPTTNRFGQADRAYSFDGDDFLRSCARAPVFESLDHSVSAWVKSTTNTECGIAGYTSDKVGQQGGNGYLLRGRQASRRLSFLEGRAAAGGGWAYADADESQAGDGRWHHLVGVRENGTARLYVDGVLQTSSTTLVPAFDDFCKVYIGGDGLGYFRGAIDSVRLYNRALSASEVLRLLNWVE